MTAFRDTADSIINGRVLWVSNILFILPRMYLALQLIGIRWWWSACYYVIVIMSGYLVNVFTWALKGLYLIESANRLILNNTLKQTKPSWKRPLDIEERNRKTKSNSRFGSRSAIIQKRKGKERKEKKRKEIFGGPHTKVAANIISIYRVK